jgi:hypothetical protein
MIFEVRSESREYSGVGGDLVIIIRCLDHVGARLKDSSGKNA